jgi:hypothetical protein
MPRLIVLVCLLACLGATATAADDSLWIEGEDAATSDLKPHPWYSQAIKTEELSGGRWLSSFDGPAEPVATWKIAVPTAGVWHLWLRVNPIQATVSWRFDNGAWTAVDAGTHAVDSINLANDGKPDLRFIAWVEAGSQELTTGAHVLALRFASPASHHGAIDCLVLTRRPFQPHGKAKPGQALTDAEPGWFACDAPSDALGADALLDLRFLNEHRAGEHGRVAVKDGHLALGDGTPVRFWAVNAGPVEGRAQAEYLAGRLAKTGVNLVRIHGAAFDRKAQDPTAIDRARLDRVRVQIAACAERGIYTHLSTYYPLWLELKPGDGIADAAIGKHPFALLFCEPRMQELWKAWAKAVLTTRDPATGKTLADDPALAFWEIQNEDSLFFWTFGKEALGPGPWSRLEGRFFAWLVKRHGSFAKAAATWGGERHGDDDEAKQRAGLYEAWHMTGDGWAKTGEGTRARVASQVRFLAELQWETYAELARFLRQDCGFKGLITASNWITADNRRLGAVERWTYAATDAIDRHGYFGGKHEGDAADWSLRPGQTYADKAAVLDPADTVLAYCQIAGKPSLQTEVMWNAPNRFIADGPLLLSAYGALQGVDAWFSFAVHDGGWVGDGSAKWPVMSPGWLGQFPAAALQFRRGDVQAGPLVSRRCASRDEILDLKTGGVSEGGNADARAAGMPVGNGVDATDPLAGFVGRVDIAIAGLPGTPPGARPVAADLRAIDRDKKVVTSATGELRWDWGHGVVSVNTPRSQAITGFLAQAGAVKLADVTIRCGNDYGTVQVISLDGQKLATAKKILIQSFSEQRLFGWKAQDGRIVDVGRPPWNVRDLDASVTFANSAGLRAVALDLHGYKRAEVAFDGATLRLPRDALYVLVTR